MIFRFCFLECWVGKARGVSSPTPTADLCVRTRGFRWEQRPYDAYLCSYLFGLFLVPLCLTICHLYSVRLVHPLISAQVFNIILDLNTNQVKGKWKHH